MSPKLQATTSGSIFSALPLPRKVFKKCAAGAENIYPAHTAGQPSNVCSVSLIYIKTLSQKPQAALFFIQTGKDTFICTLICKCFQLGYSIAEAHSCNVHLYQMYSRNTQYNNLLRFNFRDKLVY